MLRAHALVPRRPVAEWPEPVSFEVPEGQWMVIRTTPARSGALMRLCCGLDDVAAPGELEVLGARPGALGRDAVFSFRCALGVALQPDGLVSNLPLLRNLVVPLVYSGQRTPDEAAARAQAVLEQLDLAPWANARPSDLPPDVRQVAAIARALAPEPRLLVLEDPLNAVRSRMAASVLARCKALVPTAIVTVFRRFEPLYEIADQLVLWDARGFLPATEGVA